MGYKAGFSITGHDVVKTVLKSMVMRNIQGNLTIRTDNGTQFKSKEFQEFCKRQGISHEHIPERSQERNPNIERFFRILKEEFVELMTPSKFYEEILRNNASRGVLVV